MGKKLAQACIAFDILANGRAVCKACGLEMVGSATRMKGHLLGNDKNVKKCERLTDH